MTKGEIFSDLVCNFGTQAATCDCGRTHFDATGQFMEDGELEEMLRKAQAPNAKMIGRDGGVSLGTWMGRHRVWGCPCGWADRWSEELWANRLIVGQFFRKVAELQAKDAKEILDSLDDSSL